MPPPRPKGIDANTHRFFTTGKVDNNTKRSFTPGNVNVPGKKPPAYSFNEFKSDLSKSNKAISRENDKSNQRSVNVIKALGGSSKKAAEAISTPLIIACAVGGVFLILYISKK